jgi:hypothetical protein
MVKHMLIVGLCSILALEAFFPDVDLSDLSRVPELLAHYQQHKQSSPDITFLAFLRLHYSDTSDSATASAEHEKLPFSKRHHHLNILLIADEPAFIRIQTTDLLFLKSESVYRHIIRSNSKSSPVWQPPRA